MQLWTCADTGGLQTTTYLVLAGAQDPNYRTHKGNSTLLPLVTANTNCIWGLPQIGLEAKPHQCWILMQNMHLLKYDEMDSEDSRSVHRYWTWGSWIPHVTPSLCTEEPTMSFCRIISVVVFKPGMLRIH